MSRSGEAAGSVLDSLLCGALLPRRFPKRASRTQPFFLFVPWWYFAVCPWLDPALTTFDAPLFVRYWPALTFEGRFERDLVTLAGRGVRCDHGSATAVSLLLRAYAIEALVL